MSVKALPHYTLPAATLAGLILLQALQGVGVLAGAILAGAGKQQGL